ncbi:MULTISPECIES: acyl-CoA dehydrogenase family protein [unclassified Rhodococcus (in: high G+C Gram-positive bacteria)]|uniref:acyl-CoA dehydrogenase family protein n=1 Tax=unclassified Rhodococcus (in: high G+C Gram-positive bacteria) TaxID=192944 RepID=UPI00163B3041|nr:MULTISPECIES: acyl-CoA dehydrogenase family protein [unclassified Rhodococcus (in: high G+C Gram-positive bacteria)]MBC2644218.1 acyl-CoA dehydrogenase family protein [Rhodococcus sp. 3A]MBC2891043.1 acyl-CoA dehydrogenase family protein [Rhodococcus sp. 4CII]
MSSPDANHPPVLFRPEHEEFAQWVREFAAPHAESYLVRAHSEEFPWDLAEKMAAQGLLGLGVSEENGGMGRIGDVLTKTHLGIAHEELAYANFYASQLAYTNNLTGPLLEKFLAPEVAEGWVRGIVEGRHVVALGLTEPGSGSDAMAMRAKADRVDGGWKLNGEKTSITFAPHAKAMITFVKARGATPEESGVTAFLVPLDAPGVSMQKFPDAGWKPLGRAGVFLDDVFVPDEYVIGGVGNGFRLVMSEFDYTRSVIGLMSTGVARKALDLTIEYVKSRKAFGKPVASFQGVSFPIAENATKLEAARWLTYRALSLADADKPFTKEAAMTKLYATDISLQTLRDCVIAHGHSGFAEELPLQAMLRDVSGLEIGEGTPQIQKVVIARALLGREATS